MEVFLGRYRNITVLLLVLFAQLLMLAWQVRGKQDVRLIRVWAVTVITPIAKVIETVRSHTVGFAQQYFVLLNAVEENRRLKEELGKLKLQNQFLRSELEMADRVRALAAFQARSPSKTVAARVIASGAGVNSKLVYIDRGATSGIMRGMAVITPDGIVGRVLSVFPIASQVLLITDPTFAAGVISQKHRVHGTLKGQGHATCIVDYVQNEEKVEPGEMFYTAGTDRVFPKGLPAGIVKAVRPGRVFKEIIVSPTGLQHGIEEVLVVLEGVHQQIPEAGQQPAPGFSILPPPPAETTQALPTPNANPLATDADRLKERYRGIGAAQGHRFGEGGPPDFTINPAPRPPSPPAEEKPPAGSKPPAP
jgi:rod shape-determining protein MreC